jgi:hypothetical protein
MDRPDGIEVESIVRRKFAVGQKYRPELRPQTGVSLSAGDSGTVPMTLSDYRQYANQCARWAAEAINDYEREAFLEMARAWKRIALVEQDVTRQSLLEGNEVIERQLDS